MWQLAKVFFFFIRIQLKPTKSAALDGCKANKFYEMEKSHKEHLQRPRKQKNRKDHLTNTNNLPCSFLSFLCLFVSL